MNPIFTLPEASRQAARVDTIALWLLIFSGLVILLVGGLMLTFAIRYRRDSKASRGRLPEWLTREFEIGWTVATLLLFLTLFWWAMTADLSFVQAPSDPLRIEVVAKQWMWKAEHPSGAREIDALHVPLGRAVAVSLTSQDVIHSFYVPAFRLKQDALPGAWTATTFTATKEGVFGLLCAEYCGTDHSAMRGSIHVMKPQDYAAWTAAQPEGDDLARRGAALFVSAGCSGCHAGSSRVRAPRLEGLFGRSVALADGRRVTADAAYIRDSILQPKRDVVAGFDPVMPSFAGVLDDGDIQSLTAYIRSLATTASSGSEGDAR